MLGLIFPWFSFCTDSFPKISILMASDNMDSTKEEYSFNYYQQHINNIQATCNKIKTEAQKKNCIAFKKSFIGVFISKGSDLNQQISNIPNRTDILYIMIDKVSTTIDFNNLQSHMTVIVSSHDYNNGNNFLNILKNTQKIIYNSQNINYFRLTDNMLLKEDPEIEIKILGNMNLKVSHLTICSFKIKFEGDVNCQNLFLRNSIFVSRSSDLIEQLNVEYFIEDFNSYTYNMDNSYYVKQYSVYYEYTDDGLQTVLLENDLYGTTLYIGGISISYDYKRHIGLIFTASFIDILINGNEFDENTVINLTLIEDLIPLNLPAYQDARIVMISSSGESEFTENAPIFHITYNKNLVELDKKKLHIDLIEHQLYSYTPKFNIEEDNDETNSIDVDESIFDNVNSVTSEDNKSSRDDDNTVPNSSGNDSSSINGDGNNESSTKKNKNIGMIIGIILGCIVVIIIIIIVVIILIRKRKNLYFSDTEMDV